MTDIKNEEAGEKKSLNFIEQAVELSLIHILTTNLQGCALQAEGAKRASSSTRSNFSGSTGRSLSYERSL